MPIVNTMAFLFTVLGEWYLENKVISRGKMSRPFRDLSTILDQARDFSIEGFPYG